MSTFRVFHAPIFQDEAETDFLGYGVFIDCDGEETELSAVYVSRFMTVESAHMHAKVFEDGTRQALILLEGGHTVYPENYEPPDLEPEPDVERDNQPAPGATPWQQTAGRRANGEPLESEPEPTSEDLANLSSSIPGFDLLEAAQEIKSEKRRRFLDAIGGILGDMIGGGGSDPKAKEAIVEGYKDMLSSLFSPTPSFPPAETAWVVPATPPSMPASVFTCVDSQDRLTTIDFFCLLSHTIRQRISLSPMQADLTLTNGSGVTLNHAQTVAFIRYLGAIDAYSKSTSPGYGFSPGSIGIRQLDAVFLNHPAVKKILEETPEKPPEKDLYREPFMEGQEYGD